MTVMLWWPRTSSISVHACGLTVLERSSRPVCCHRTIGSAE